LNDLGPKAEKGDFKAVEGWISNTWSSSTGAFIRKNKVLESLSTSIKGTEAGEDLENDPAFYNVPSPESKKVYLRPFLITSCTDLASLNNRCKPSLPLLHCILPLGIAPCLDLATRRKISHKLNRYTTTLPTPPGLSCHFPLLSPQLLRCCAMASFAAVFLQRLRLLPRDSTSRSTSSPRRARQRTLKAQRRPTERASLPLTSERPASSTLALPNRGPVQRGTAPGRSRG
jgi:hypothetical protein